MYWTEFLTVALIHLLAVASPGPDFAVVIRESVSHGRRAGICTALGVGCGISLHVAYSLLGIGLIVAQSLTLFTLLKWLAAGYLLYIGVRALRARPADPALLEALGDGAARSGRGAFASGFLTNALNPKTTVFIVSLFMQVVRPDTPLAVQIGYGAFISVAHMAWFSLVALCFSAGAVRDRLLAVRHWIDRAFGGLLVGLGLLLAVARGSR